MVLDKTITDETARFWLMVDEFGLGHNGAKIDPNLPEQRIVCSGCIKQFRSLDLLKRQVADRKANNEKRLYVPILRRNRKGWQ